MMRSFNRQKGVTAIEFVMGALILFLLLSRFLSRVTKSTL